MKTPENKLKVAADGIAAQLMEGVDENAIRAQLFLAGADMDDINRAMELAKEQVENTATYHRTRQHDGTIKGQAAELAEYAKDHGMEVAPSFKEKLKKARKAAGLTQQTMADRMLIPKRTVEDWERGISAPAQYVQRFVLNELEQLTGEHPAVIDRETWEQVQAKIRDVQAATSMGSKTIPFGYMMEDDRLVINKKEAELAQKMCDEYIKDGYVSMETTKAIREAYAAREEKTSRTPAKLSRKMK